MQATAYQCIAAGREYIRIGDIIVALYGEKNLLPVIYFKKTE